MEAMHFRRWLDIKVCLKQSAFWEEKKKTDEGYDPTQKYRLVWDVMTHNMNQLIDKGGLDLTLDETTWPNSSHADIQGRLKGKKTDKGGQHVLLLHSKRRYIYAYTPRHKFFEVVHPFTAIGPAEVKRLVDNITPLVVGAPIVLQIKESKYSASVSILQWTTYSVVMRCCVILGREVGKER